MGELERERGCIEESDGEGVRGAGGGCTSGAQLVWCGCVCVCSGGCVLLRTWSRVVMSWGSG